MTPLAQKITRESTLLKRDRTFSDHDSLIKRMDDIHCFEVTDVYQLAFDLASDVERICDGPLTSFLPAPKTWIEWRSGPGERYGLLIEQKDIVCDLVRTTGAYLCPGQNFFGTMRSDQLSLSKGYSESRPTCSGDRVLPPGYYKEGFSPCNLIPAFLLLINSPKVIGRCQHMPHRGLERRLVAAKKMVGKFPLHAWTEIKLEVNTEPQYAGNKESVEAHLTGERALHFCRSHIRVRLGRLEVVRAHWRGDPSLGIKQSRYTLIEGRA